MSSGESSPVMLTSDTATLTSHTPKYGTVIPNRIFVGGIAANTTEQELKDYFTNYGAVKDSKIIADRAGVSKGYGFITFETHEDAEKIIKKESDNLIFKERKLNIGPAVRKQQAFPRLYDSNLQASILFAQNGVPYTFQNGVAFFHGGAESSVYPSNVSVQPQPTAPSYPGTVMVPPATGVQPATGTVYMQPYPATAYATPTSPAVGAGAQYSMYPNMHLTSDYTDLMMAHYQPDVLEAAAHAEAKVDNWTTHQYEDSLQQHLSSGRMASSGFHSAISGVPTYHVQLSANNPTVVPAQQQIRSHQAYKRPMPPTTTSRKILTSATAVYSPRGTPPCKIPALQRALTTNSSGMLVADSCSSDGASITGALTPPVTSDVKVLLQ